MCVCRVTGLLRTEKEREEEEEVEEEVEEEEKEEEGRWRRLSGGHNKPVRPAMPSCPLLLLKATARCLASLLSPLFAHIDAISPLFQTCNVSS